MLFARLYQNRSLLFRVLNAHHHHLKEESSIAETSCKVPLHSFISGLRFGSLSIGVVGNFRRFTAGQMFLFWYSRI